MLDSMSIKLEPSWKQLLETEFSKEYFQELIAFVKEEYKTGAVYPPGPLIFNAFDHCPVSETKVIILGQDPYHGPGQANGLAFSVNDGVRIPPSLRNIYQEIHDDLGKEIPETGNLERWAEQGVLLLNATLTVRAKQAGSHQDKGWEAFTDAAIKAISQKKENLVFMLWGSYAKKKAQVIENRKNHLILEAAHPSPFSADRGFFGCRHFSQANIYLAQNGKQAIKW